MSKCGVTATQFKLYPGESLVVKGKILPNSKEFVINLGKDCDNLVLHYNPRFECKADVNTVVCNSRRGSTWEDEIRATDFPFRRNSEVEITFCFTEDGIQVKTERSKDLVFPNRLGLNMIDYLGVDGDFRIKSVTFP